MKTSQRGVDLIRQFEGLSLTAVKLAGEAYYTIGYGHYGAEVQAGQRITEAEAEALLRRDLAQFEQWVTQYTPFSPTQNQFDALVSFTYNCGPGSLRQLVTGRTAAQVAEHMMAYTKSGSAAYTEGLRNRRAKERALFLEEDEMTQEQFNAMMDAYLKGLAEQEPAAWSADDRRWAEEAGVIRGTGSGMKYKSFVTREEMVALLHRVASL